MILQKVFKKNKGEFCYEEQRTSRTHPPQLTVAQEAALDSGGWCGSPLGLILCFSSFSCELVSVSSAASSTYDQYRGWQVGVEAEADRGCSAQSSPLPGAGLPAHVLGASLLVPVKPPDTHLGRRKICLETQSQTNSVGKANLCSIPLSHHVIKSEDNSWLFFSSKNENQAEVILLFGTKSTWMPNLSSVGLDTVTR